VDELAGRGEKILTAKAAKKILKKKTAELDLRPSRILCDLGG